MKIIFLGPKNKHQLAITKFLQLNGEKVFHYSSNIFKEKFRKNRYNFLISYGFRYIIKKEILDYYSDNAINLHISYLPWNRGADPNLWSFLEDTPHGVSIHLLDEKLDAGPIIFQKELFFNDNQTLRSTYNTLQNEIVNLFKLNWINIKNKNYKVKAQPKSGSFHKSSDKDYLIDLLKNGWETKVKDIKGKVNNASNIKY